MSDEENCHRFDRRLICVKYPAVVNNDTKVLETLGGIQNISNVFATQNQRLSLHFRSDDPHSKAVYADREKVAGLLIRVRVPKKSKAGSKAGFTYTVIGSVTESFIFKSLCDFQYLPQMSGPEGEPQKCIIEQLFPSQRIPTLSWIKEPNKHLFLLPPALSRMDTSNPFCYRNENTDVATPDNSNALLKTSRPSRKSFTQRILFDEKMIIPSAPVPAAVKDLSSKKINANMVSVVKKLFEDRPIWSRIALQIECEIQNPNCLKSILPCVAYYFMSGPWRFLWVRFGYDPSISSESRSYQVIDYRVQSQSLRDLVKARNTYRPLHVPSKHQKIPKRTFLSSEVFQDTTGIAGKEKYDESCYKFRKGLIPAHRHMLYQFVDLDIREIQDILKSPTIPGVPCHEKFGWLQSSVFEMVRKIIDEVATATVATLHGQGKEEEEVEAETFADSTDSEGSSLVIISSSESDSEPEPQYEVPDDSS